ncbi:MAG TPA: amino acid transport protein [Thermoanaerobaculia bacterium]|nr:amino acid transport protein [Thermoanaerobaculia bacterium]
MPTFILGILVSAFGMGYFVYGKKEQKAAPMISGAILCVYPYFVDNFWWSLIIGACLLAAPFLVDF